jgi:hypothetical protein
MTHSGHQPLTTTVLLWLLVGQLEYPLAAIGPDSITFREYQSFPPCDGEILMTVDGDPRTWPVSLSSGADGAVARIDDRPMSRPM